jgi:translation initiation factor 4E
MNRPDRVRLLDTKEKVEFHDLQDIWTFYYLIPNRMGQRDINWVDFLKPLHDFSNFEDFWAILNTIDRASELPKGCRYYIFKKGIQPLWEDESNVGGCELYTDYPNPEQPKPSGKQRNAKSPPSELVGNREAEEHWKDLALSVLANAKTIPHRQKINGIEFNCRGSVVKVGIWVAPTLSDRELEELAPAIKTILKSERDLMKSRIQRESEKTPEGPSKP